MFTYCGMSKNCARCKSCGHYLSESNTAPKEFLSFFMGCFYEHVPEDITIPEYFAKEGIGIEIDFAPIFYKSRALDKADTFCKQTPSVKEFDTPDKRNRFNKEVGITYHIISDLVQFDYNAWLLWKGN